LLSWSSHNWQKIVRKESAGLLLCPGWRPLLLSITEAVVSSGCACSCNKDDWIGGEFEQQKGRQDLSFTGAHFKAQSRLRGEHSLHRKPSLQKAAQILPNIQPCAPLTISRLWMLELNLAHASSFRYRSSTSKSPYYSRIH